MTGAPASGMTGTGLAAYVTATVGDQLFGVAIEQVHDVFNLGPVTPVPLAPASIVGLLNLRGRVVTAIDLRRRLGMAGTGRPVGCVAAGRMAIGMEAERQSYCLVVDAIGEIVRVEPDTLEPNPIHLPPGWAALSRGVHRLPGALLVTLDVPAVLRFDDGTPPARLS